MNIRDIWRVKTDDEVSAAFRQLEQYTDETQLTIRAEYDRRSLQGQLPVDSVPFSTPTASLLKSSSPRQSSLKSAQAYLASLEVRASTASVDSASSNGIRQKSSSHLGIELSASEPKRITTGYEYKVVPFIGQSKGSVSTSDVARQLESVITQHALAGWEFCQISDVNIEVQPGCFAGLFGASVQYIRFDQLIFKKLRTA